MNAVFTQSLRVERLAEGTGSSRLIGLLYRGAFFVIKCGREAGRAFLNQNTLSH